MSSVLPEDVIVDILSERFQLSDCNRGIIIDGLDTLFAQNYLLACTAVLKAFNNRRYIYCVTMKSNYQKYKEQMNKIQEEIRKFEMFLADVKRKLISSCSFLFNFVWSGKKKLEQEKLDKILLEEMDEETYNNLPFEKRKEIDDRLLETKKFRMKRWVFSLNFY